MEEQEVFEDKIFSTEIAEGRLGEEGQRQRRLSSEVDKKAFTYLLMMLMTLLVLPTTIVKGC